MRARLLDGIRVLVVAGDPGLMAGRVLADLGAAVTVVALGEADPAATDTVARQAWTRGTQLLDTPASDVDLQTLVSGCDIVIETPHWPGAPACDVTWAPQAVWVRITPFGLGGPRGSWRASDLGIHAASGNLFATGDPDRAPVRCSENVAYAHSGPEAAMAALTALASGRPQVVDLSMQEAVLVANMGSVGRFHREQSPGRRQGATIGRTREIWPCADGWVSFGIRGGRARVATWTTVVELARADGIDVSHVEGWDWPTFNHAAASDEDLARLSSIVEQFVAGHTLRELYAWACEHNLTLAPINGPAEILASEQLAAREFFAADGMPNSFVRVVEGPNPLEIPAIDRENRRQTRGFHEGRAWEGTTILEFGAGAAGPVATRYFAEHGATVIRVESTTRPDFLRAYALGPENPHGLEGSALFDALNTGKRSITVNLKHPDGNALVRRLIIERADAVAENFAPKGMTGLGLDYDALVAERPDLVMISACLNGHTGPHKDYPGFGSQGAALSGYTFLTGWPDREPIGPYGTITDSLAPRFVATAMAAGLLHQRRTGRGVYLDLAQVEAAVWALSPWMLRFSLDGIATQRCGNRSDHTAPHGVFPCAGDDRWVALAVWTDDEWQRLADVVGIDDPNLRTRVARLERQDDIEAAIATWTSSRDADTVADELQRRGLEAVPVADFAAVFTDPQLAARGHLVALTHGALGDGRYERNGFRLSDGDGGLDRASPLLGEGNDWVFGDLLGLSSAQQARLRDAGALD